MILLRFKIVSLIVVTSYDVTVKSLKCHKKVASEGKVKILVQAYSEPDKVSYW